MNRIYTTTRFTALICLLLLCLPQMNNFCYAGTNDLVVETKQGKVRGTMEKNICVWRGIPYAKAPVGKLRFKAPQPPESWTGVKDAVAFGPIAHQFRSAALTEPGVESEDCLFLNVWSPAADGKKRPVMFWIHGGGFMGGSGSSSMYDGTNLAAKGDVVIVTINYRLGAFGFLYFNDIPGNKEEFDNNVGIKDQIAALKWVKENIAAFGGDPEAVTIFGESAGAISVQTLMAVPQAKGLFHRAIVESGNSEILWDPKIATEMTLKYLKLVGVSPDDLSKLKSIPADTLSACLSRMMNELVHEPKIKKLLAPTVDGDFIPKQPMACIDAGYCRDVDLLIGTNLNEANLFAMKRLNMAPTTPEKLEPYLAKIEPGARTRLLGSYKDYPSKDGILELITDATFTMPSIQFAEDQCTHGATYMYRFDWYSKPLKWVGLKACHGLELPFVFGTFSTGLGKKITFLANKKNIHKLSDSIQQAWLNFAKTGNPNNHDWKKYDNTERTTMIFNTNIHASNDPKAEQRKAWKGIDIIQ